MFKSLYNSFRRKGWVVLCANFSVENSRTMKRILCVLLSVTFLSPLFASNIKVEDFPFVHINRSNSNISYDGCNYITFRLDKHDEKSFVEIIMDDIKTNGINCDDLIAPSETPVYDKYDVYIPSPLLRKAYATDKLNEKEVIERIKTLHDQFQ